MSVKRKIIFFVTEDGYFFPHRLDIANALGDRGVITIVLGARMRWDKGIGELIHAVKILWKKKIVFHVLPEGIPDPAPNTICEDMLQKWHDQGIVEWIGYQKDMAYASIIS